MLTLYSYPNLFGVADNNPYGLKVYAFLRLAGLEFRHEHIFDASAAPRGQLPYITDDDKSVGDSDSIVAYVTASYGVAMDAGLDEVQRTTHHFIRRTLDDLYWVMSYSRWSDARFSPLFRDEMLRTHRQVTEQGMDAAREYNLKRYHYQGIGRYAPDEVYARGTADLAALISVTPAQGFLFGAQPSSIDAAVYGFVANILYFRIETPLKQLVDSCPDLVRLVEAIHARVS